MHQEEVYYECKEHFEAMVFSAVQQLLEHYQLPSERDDRDMYHEHPMRWPLPEKSLRRPSGERAKHWDGLTHGMREWLKYGANIKGPDEILFGIKVLAWWHREVWNNGMKDADHKTFGEHMCWYLSATRTPTASLEADELATLRKLYGVEEAKAAA